MRHAITLLVLLAACTLGRGDDAKRPNVVIVLVDDFGWGDPACYGNTLVKTPNMDRLAKEGVRFTQGYVAAPICSPFSSLSLARRLTPRRRSHRQRRSRHRQRRRPQPPLRQKATPET